VAPTGQTLYYTIVNSSEVSVTYPSGNHYQPYGGFSEPTGELSIPSTVTNSGTTYSVTSIGERTFYGCSGLTLLSIPNTVISIARDAVSLCSGLTSLTIPNSVTSIGRTAFYGCSGLTSLTIPNSVTSIALGAFGSCSGLAFIEVSSSNTVYDSRENCNAIIETASNTLVCGCVNTVIPYSITSIGNSAFAYCGLTSLTIPNSVTSIGNSAFYKCYDLTSLTIGNSVASIDTCAFTDCYSLTSLIIPNSVTSIGDGAFSGCSGLTEINCLRATAPTLLTYSFYNVDNTIPVNIPCGSTASYQSEWSYFSNFNEVFSTYTLDVYSSDEAMGSASITTLPNCNDNTAVVEATANAGYLFDHWSDGSTANPYTVQLTDNTTLIAHFSANTGIEEMDDSGILVYAKDHQIHIDAAIGETVNVYTIDGRTIATMLKATEHVAFPVATAGVYLVKIGNRPARKVVVVW
ncbi:MAG: leucine-rich repeat domain-containing protein, partial [Bacteroidales bacterium]|nr:leucine-rich repeat domain-containing protein [Bacteroidales bacterium]